VRNGVDEAKADEIFRGIDVDSSGEIQYSEWLAATVEARCVVDREEMADAFQRIADGGRVITRAHLAKLLGQGLSKKQAKDIIAELDENGDGVIDLDEFLTLVERREGRCLFSFACFDVLSRADLEIFMTRRYFRRLLRGGGWYSMTKKMEACRDPSV